MQILSHSRNTHTVYNAYTYTHTVTRAYCKLQKLLPLAKLISKYASWHLMPSVTEIRAKDPAGGLKFSRWVMPPSGSRFVVVVLPLDNAGATERKKRRGGDGGGGGERKEEERRGI